MKDNLKKRSPCWNSFLVPQDSTAIASASSVSRALGIGSLQASTQRPLLFTATTPPQQHQTWRVQYPVAVETKMNSLWCFLIHHGAVPLREIGSRSRKSSPTTRWVVIASSVQSQSNHQGGCGASTMDVWCETKHSLIESKGTSKKNCNKKGSVS